VPLDVLTTPHRNRYTSSTDSFPSYFLHLKNFSKNCGKDLLGLLFRIRIIILVSEIFFVILFLYLMRKKKKEKKKDSPTRTQTLEFLFKNISGSLLGKYISNSG
jgi:hypothetical protein